MKQLVSVIALLISLTVASEASASSCTDRTGFTLDPYTPYKSLVNGFLQGFTSSNFSCSGDASYQHCVHKTQVFNFYFDYGVVYVYTGSTWTHTGSFNGSGAVYNWSWDGGSKSGTLNWSCLAYDLNFNCTNYAWGTCD